jgi:ABC-2 type transport system permease protein
MSTTLTRTRALAGTELRVLVRNRVVAASALVFPLLLSALTLINREELDKQAWATQLSLVSMAIVLLSCYVPATTTLAARRESLMLKRLRAGELSGPAILTGLLAPLAAVTLIQIVIFVAVAVSAGAGPPDRPMLAVGALSGAILVTLTAGVLTSVVTGTPERAQITTIPLFVAAFGAILLAPAVSGDGIRLAVLAVPLAAAADLLRRAWGGGLELNGELAGLPLVPLELGVTAAWAVVLALVARRWFRWEPRS